MCLFSSVWNNAAQSSCLFPLFYAHKQTFGALKMRSHFIKCLTSFVVVYYDFIFTRMPRMTLSQKRLLVSLTPTRFCVFNKRRERRQLYAMYLRCVRHVVLVTVAAFPLLLHQEWWNSLTMSMLITTTRPSILAITSTNLLVGLCYDEKKFNLPPNIFPNCNIQDCLMWNIDCSTCCAYTLCNMRNLCLACVSLRLHRRFSFPPLSAMKLHLTSNVGDKLLY